MTNPCSHQPTECIAWADNAVRGTRNVDYHHRMGEAVVTYTYIGVMADGTEVPLLPYGNKLPLTYGELPDSYWMPPPPPPTLVVPIGKRDIRLG